MGRSKGPLRKRSRQTDRRESPHRSASKFADAKQRPAKRKFTWEASEENITCDISDHPLYSRPPKVVRRTEEHESQAYRILTHLSRGGVDISSPSSSEQEDQKVCQDFVPEVDIGAVCEVGAYDYLGAECAEDSVADFTLNASELFQLILNDHQYLKTDSSTGLPLSPDLLSEVSPGTEESATEGSSDVGGLPDAESIQRFFLDTVNMISYKPMTDVDGEQLSSEDVESLDSLSTTQSEDCQPLDRSSDLSADLWSDLDLGSVEGLEPSGGAGDEVSSDYSNKRRSVVERVQLTSLLRHAVDLLLKMWESYLLLSTEDIRQRELAAAEELHLSDEAMEMLKDTDRYVWQLVEESGPSDLAELLASF